MEWRSRKAFLLADRPRYSVGTLWNRQRSAVASHSTLTHIAEEKTACVSIKSILIYLTPSRPVADGIITQKRAPLAGAAMNETAAERLAPLTHTHLVT